MRRDSGGRSAGPRSGGRGTFRVNRMEGGFPTAGWTSGSAWRFREHAFTALPSWTLVGSTEEMEK